MKDKSIGLEIKKIDNLMLRKMLAFSKTVTNVTLSPVQISIIEFLKNNEDKSIYQKDIENFLGHRKSTISGILDTMEKNKLILKINSKKDLRSKQIKLTSEAKYLFNKIENEKDEFEKILSNNISEKDLEIFFKVTNQIKLNLKGENNDRII